MLDELEALLTNAVTAAAEAPDAETLRDLEVKQLGKKGAVTALLKGMGKVPKADRRAVGARVNTVRQEVQAAIDARRAVLEAEALAALLHDPTFDPTLPATADDTLPTKAGSIHPVNEVAAEIADIFRAMGFHVLDYQEVEDEAHNFEGLNIPADHPARDMQDTFWLTDGNLLRTHTSPGQLRAMSEFEPPFRAVFPGRVYRMEEVDASHDHTFHQCEGIMIDRDVSVANLIDSMRILVSEVMKRDAVIRLRPGYFPFVEPGFELDMQCHVCGGSGCSTCKQTGWIELLPCGLIHPNVLRAGGLDPEEWGGWAFGLGLSRLVMGKYGIDDVRRLQSGDTRFSAQFRRG